MTPPSRLPEIGLDVVLHQPIRTQIVAYLVGRGEATFTELKQMLQVSDGNLDSHMKKLIAADYVGARKDNNSARQQTIYSLTTAGEAALRRYIGNLQRMLGLRSVKEKARARPSPGAKGKLAWNS
jgi:DNA-binding MarR family transcriptional regulator